MKNSGSRADVRVRMALAVRFQQAEHLLYITVGLTLALAGLVLFGQVLYAFANHVADHHLGLAPALLKAVDGLLLVFIFAELLHTIRVVIAEDTLRVEPFLAVGIAAASGGSSW